MSSAGTGRTESQESFIMDSESGRFRLGPVRKGARSQPAACESLASASWTRSRLGPCPQEGRGPRGAGGGGRGLERQVPTARARFSDVTPSSPRRRAALSLPLLRERLQQERRAEDAHPDAHQGRRAPSRSARSRRPCLLNTPSALRGTVNAAAELHVYLCEGTPFG